MAQDSFLRAFHHGLPWQQLAHAAATVAPPFDALQVLQGGGAGAVWDHHDVAMSTALLSPLSLAATSFGGGGAHEAALMEQLASRLGISVPSPSRYASCHSTPAGSPSSNPPVAPANAARVSCLAGSGGELSRVASSHSLLGDSPGGVTLHTSDGSSSDGPSRKRKAPAGGKSKAKEAVTAATPKSMEVQRRSKKSKLSADADEDEDDEPKPAAQRNGKGKEVVVAEPPKDYIHVRARRGQATDSHSLAERVRREKISERMKLLQDIVPGCNKVTGKAVMLDEIINYVQSLQRQVEFLSMKLSTVNPRLEVDVDSFIPKDANHQSCVTAPTTSLPPPPVYSMEGSNSAFCYASSPAPAAVQSPVTNTNNGFDETPSSFVNHSIVQDHSSLQGFQNANPQIGSHQWEDDLQSLVQMGFRGTT